MFEALIATLLFSISALGLLKYQQKLLQGFQRQWQMKQASALIQKNIAIFFQKLITLFFKINKPNIGLET
ncbi:type IV pilus modification PilV family protein [Candidatus Williamhamiltonella defendens]|uniref:type IV pilus modification PilV family protein n=1 Tax=Candidatus Williamhamiltonella defendens TaxID=138072 RepID=UPI001F390DE0